MTVPDWILPCHLSQAPIVMLLVGESAEKEADVFKKGTEQNQETEVNQD